MKILTMYHSNQGGGCLNKLYDFIEACLKKNIEVHYISTGKFPIIHSQLGYHHIYRIFNNKYLFFCYFFLLLPFYIFFLNLKHDYDKIIVFGSEYAFASILVKMVFKKEIITFIRGNNFTEYQLKKYSKFVFFFSYIISFFGLRSSDKIITVTKDLVKILKKRYKLKTNNFSVLYNNIKYRCKSNKEKDLREEFKIEKDEFIIGYIGRFDPIKNVDFLIESFLKVNNSRNVKLLIVGDGAERDKLKKIVKSNNAIEKIIFTGWRDDVDAILPFLDLVVLPSKYEGCPGVLLEALGKDIPCVGSNRGGIVEILKYNELLFNPDDCKTLIEKLISLIDDHVFYQKVKELCRERRGFFDFDWDEKLLRMIT